MLYYYILYLEPAFYRFKFLCNQLFYTHTPTHILYEILIIELTLDGYPYFICMYVLPFKYLVLNFYVFRFERI